MRISLPLTLLALLALALPAGAAHAAFPGRNGEVAYGWFSLQEDELGERPSTSVRALRTVAPAGGDPRDLLSCTVVGDDARGGCGPTTYADPAYTADGRRIAFDTGARLALVGAGGGTVRLLPRRGADDSHPAFAPTGARLAFDTMHPVRRSRTVWVADVSGGGARRIAAGSRPDWSTRDLIAFERDGQVWTIRPDGRGARRLTSAGGRAATWSPHGTKLAFVRGRAGHVHVMGADGRGARRVPGVRGALSVSWSPDGRWLLYEAFDAGLHIIRPDGRGARQLVEGGAGATYSLQTRGADWRPLRR